MKPLICSFYTLGSGYEQEAREMVDSASAFGLECEVRGVPDLGSWVRNCGQKPGYILGLLCARPGRPLVWTDADSRFRRRAELFDYLDCDFAAHFRHGAELLSGTTFWSNTEKSRDLAQAWWFEQCDFPTEWDQKTLQRVIEENRVPGLRVERLPSTYTRIFDAPEMGEAVIEHGQFSRRLKATA